MISFIARRLAYSALSLLLLSLTIFLFVRLTGDPAVLFVEPGASQADLDAVREQFGLVHVHGNNYRPLIPDTGVPAVLEMSFAHKALAGGPPLPSSATYPIEGLDWPCNPARPDYPLTF